MTIYLLDADVLIRAKNQHYAFDLCPGFWNWIDREHAAGKVFSVRKVYDEILAGKDDLSEWAKERAEMFLAPDQSTTQSFQRVSTWASTADYKPNAVSLFMSKADYYLVAQALALGYTVVTYEKPDPGSRRSIKIPDACKAVDVDWTSPHEMLLAEGVSFHL